jgi:hypothetical protein
MVKRKATHDKILIPKKSRLATHSTSNNITENVSSSATSDDDSDSWYYSDGGNISQAYWDFAAKHGQRTTKTYLPDDGKCDRCFRGNRICDATLNGTPCSICVRTKSTCAPQSRKTRRLVLPENRSKSKPIPYPISDPPCRVCFQTDRPCHLEPGTEQCNRCKTKNVRCNWNLEGAKNSNSQQGSKEAK